VLFLRSRKKAVLHLNRVTRDDMLTPARYFGGITVVPDVVIAIVNAERDRFLTRSASDDQLHTWIL
jgi:hypothetical protein